MEAQVCIGVLQVCMSVLQVYMDVWQVLVGTLCKILFQLYVQLYKL